MGASESDALTETEKTRLTDLAGRLGAAIASNDCILVTGATTGLPELVAKAFREHGGAIALGISPAINAKEHAELYRLPAGGMDVIVYTGFGLKGRNVVNVRSADIVILLGGATGTLNEFTIAYDEGKIIGVLEGSGGVSDHIREIIDFCKKPTRGEVIFQSDPELVVTKCLEVLGFFAFLNRRGHKSIGHVLETGRHAAPLPVAMKYPSGQSRAHFIAFRS